MQFPKHPQSAQNKKTLYQVIAGSLEAGSKNGCHHQLQEKATLLEQAMDDTLLVMARMVEQKDPYTAGHQLRVSCLASDIALQMGWSPERCDLIRRAGMIHDIGKIGIPSDLLTKPAHLTPLEMALIRTHAETGFQMVKDIFFFTPLAEIIRQHHERLDGSGYPRGLTEDEILPEARVLAVADVFEAMSSHRPYRPANSLEASLAEISNRSLYDGAPANALQILIWEKDYQLPT